MHVNKQNFSRLDICVFDSRELLKVLKRHELKKNLWFQTKVLLVGCTDTGLSWNPTVIKCYLDCKMK